MTEWSFYACAKLRLHSPLCALPAHPFKEKELPAMNMP